MSDLDRPEPARPAVRKVAAFDFDGTITRRDTLGPFLAFACGRRAFWAGMVRHSPGMAAALIGWRARDTEKERLITHLLANRRYEHLVELGLAFAGVLWEERDFRNDVLARIDHHRDQGHELVLISASIDVYVAPLGKRLGFDHVIATRLAVDADGLTTGRLAGGNVRGAQKAVRLREWLGTAPAEIWAYGDSAGDRELLAMADHPTKV